MGDDVLALLVISFVYSERIDVTAALVAVALLGALLAVASKAVVHPAPCVAR